MVLAIYRRAAGIKKTHSISVQALLSSSIAPRRTRLRPSPSERLKGDEHVLPFVCFRRFRLHPHAARLYRPGRCHDAPSLTILAQDEENAEVQNLLEPQTDSGQPGGPPGGGDASAQPETAPKAGEEMKAMPEGGDSEMDEMQDEE